MFFDFRAFARYTFFLLGLYPLSTLTNLFLHLLLFSQISFLTILSIISRHLIILDSPRFREKISSCLSLRGSGIIIRHLIVLTSSFWRVVRAKPFLYLSILGRLAQDQRPERRDVLWLFCWLLRSHLGPKIFSGYMIFWTSTQSLKRKLIWKLASYICRCRNYFNPISTGLICQWI